MSENRSLEDQVKNHRKNDNHKNWRNNLHALHSFSQQESKRYYKNNKIKSNSDEKHTWIVFSKFQSVNVKNPFIPENPEVIAEILE